MSASPIKHMKPSNLAKLQDFCVTEEKRKKSRMNPGDSVHSGSGIEAIFFKTLLEWNEEAFSIYLTAVYL